MPRSVPPCFRRPRYDVPRASRVTRAGWPRRAPEAKEKEEEQQKKKGGAAIEIDRLTDRRVDDD